MGILGALDPFRNKMMGRLQNQLRDSGGAAGAASGAASGAGEAAAGAASAAASGAAAMAARGGAAQDEGELADPPASSPDYYPTVAIRALIRILRDPSLAVHHKNVTKAIMFIFRSLDVKCVDFIYRYTLCESCSRFDLPPLIYYI